MFRIGLNKPVHSILNIQLNNCITVVLQTFEQTLIHPQGPE